MLVLGGVGMIGRNLVKMLVDTGGASFVRVMDKAMPVMAYCA